MAYPAADGIHILDLASRAENVLAGISGFDLHWSPDGSQIAYLAMEGDLIDSVFVIHSDGSGKRQISDLSYERIAGWSANSAQLYFTVPYSGGAAWNVYAFDLAGGTTQELFTIEDGTPKALNPSLSPDGNWMAYRGRDNSSVYLMHPDGSDGHLVLDSANAFGIAWGGSSWLGVSLDQGNDNGRVVVLVNPDTCQVYRLPGLNGDLEGLYMP